MYDGHGKSITTLLGGGVYGKNGRMDSEAIQSKNRRTILFTHNASWTDTVYL